MITEEASADLGDALRGAGLDSLEGAFLYAGGEDLDKPGLGTRRRTRVTLTDGAGREHRLYLKRYSRGPITRQIAHLWRGCPSQRELRNIRAVRGAGVRTMVPVAEGHENPLSGGRSYLVVTEVPGEALERCAGSYLSAGGDTAGERLALALADLAASLHGAGLVHRDFYASHVFLEETRGTRKLWLIDLARVFRPRWRLRRWRVKDLAQLQYSMPEPWVGKHWDSLLERYLTASHWQVRFGRIRREIRRKADSIARRAKRRSTRNACGDSRE